MSTPASPNQTYLSVIIPCYNEEKRVQKTLDAVIAFLHSRPYQSEIVVVDNGSQDKTVQILKSYQGKFPHFKIVIENSHGKGWAVKQGMLVAEGHFRLFTDADNSTDIRQVEQLLTFAEAGYDVVVSSRKAPGAKIIHPQPRFRVILGNLFQGLVQLIVPLPVKDTQNGFKLFSAKATEKIFPHQDIYYWAFDVELIALAEKFGFRVKEVPITWVNDDQSKMNFKGMARMLFEVILIRLRLATRDYAN